MSPTVLSTDPLAPAERPIAWREWMWRQFGGLESDLYGDTQFNGRVSTGQAGDVVLTHLEANRHRVIRSPQLARASDRDYLKIVAPLAGSAGVEQHGRETWVRAGHWAIYDTTQAYTVANPEWSEHLIVMLPRARLAQAGLHLAPLMARQAHGGMGISRVALQTLHSTYQELPHMGPAEAHGAGELVLQLVQLSLLELAGRHTAHSQREALRDRIRQTVAQHLRDPDLSVERLAQWLNCSKRHLHNAFADSSETLAASIQRQRLEACMRELRHPDQRCRSVTDIALSWGFGNPSHFSRLFRAHTGLSPSDYRTLHTSDAH